MAKLFDKHKKNSYGLETETMLKLNKLSKKLKVNQSWLIMQMTEMLIDKPSVLFDYLSNKTRN